MLLLNKNLFCVRNQMVFQDGQICNYSFVLEIRIFESSSVATPKIFSVT